MHSNILPNISGRDRVPSVLFYILLAGIGCLFYGALISKEYHLAPSLMWAFGSGVTGAMLGFIFAIPRTKSLTEEGANDKTNKEPEQSTVRGFEGEANSRGTVKGEINSNLVEVSDWLTKIIVGVGLVELKSLPDKLERLAIYISPSLGFTDNTVGGPVVQGITLFFSVHGFLSGYLLTRIYLSIIIILSDHQVTGVNIELPGGNKVQIDDAIQQLQTSVKDLQKYVVEKEKDRKQGQQMTEPTISKFGERYRILWVDDHPSTNSLLVARLYEDDVAVKQVASTSEALLELKGQRFDAVITDMRRDKDGDTAGLDLTRVIKKEWGKLPVLIYCRSKYAHRYHAEARDAEATIITASQTILLAELANIFKEKDNPNL